MKHFHRIVHGVEHHQAQSKELGLAVSLLAQHGFERTQFIIQYAANSAKKTSFDVIDGAKRNGAGFRTASAIRKLTGVAAMMENRPCVLIDASPVAVFISV